MHKRSCFFQQGQALLDAGDFDAACAKFEASESLENGLGTLLQLADCYQRTGRTASAWHTFLEAEALAHYEKDREREQLAAQRVAALDAKLVRVMLVVPMTSRVPGLTVQTRRQHGPRQLLGRNDSGRSRSAAGDSHRQRL